MSTKRLQQDECDAPRAAKRGKPELLATGSFGKVYQIPSGSESRVTKVQPNKSGTVARLKSYSAGRLRVPLSVAGAFPCITVQDDRKYVYTMMDKFEPILSVCRRITNGIKGLVLEVFRGSLPFFIVDMKLENLMMTSKRELRVIDVDGIYTRCYGEEVPVGELADAGTAQFVGEPPIVGGNDTHGYFWEHTGIERVEVLAYSARAAALYTLLEYVALRHHAVRCDVKALIWFIHARRGMEATDTPFCRRNELFAVYETHAVLLEQVYGAGFVGDLIDQLRVHSEQLALPSGGVPSTAL